MYLSLASKSIFLQFHFSPSTWLSAELWLPTGPRHTSKRRKTIMKNISPSCPRAFSCEKEAFSLSSGSVSSSKFWQQLKSNHSSPSKYLYAGSISPPSPLPQVPHLPQNVHTLQRETWDTLKGELHSAGHYKCCSGHTPYSPRMLPVSSPLTWKLLVSICQQESIL